MAGTEADLGADKERGFKQAELQWCREEISRKLALVAGLEERAARLELDLGEDASSGQAEQAPAAFVPPEGVEGGS